MLPSIRYVVYRYVVLRYLLFNKQLNYIRSLIFESVENGMKCEVT